MEEMVIVVSKNGIRTGLHEGRLLMNNG